MCGKLTTYMTIPQLYPIFAFFQVCAENQLHTGQYHSHTQFSRDLMWSFVCFLLMFAGCCCCCCFLFKRPWNIHSTTTFQHRFSTLQARAVFPTSQAPTPQTHHHLNTELPCIVSLKAGTVRYKLQALVYDILPSTTAVFSYAIGSRKLSANEQFFVGAQTVVSLLQTAQIISDVCFITDHVAYQNGLNRDGTLSFFF